MTRTWNVYLSGEIHTDWRDTIESMTTEAGLPIAYSGPVTDHGLSDDCGVEILGKEDETFWHDRKGAQLNAIRTRTLLKDADVVVVRFGEKYRQWNAAFEAGMASALGIPLVIIHPDEFGHALKEVDGAALAVTESPDQVAQILHYVITGTL